MATIPGTSPFSIPLRRTWSICGSVCMASLPISIAYPTIFRLCTPEGNGDARRERAARFTLVELTALMRGEAPAASVGRAFAQAFTLRHKSQARVAPKDMGSTPPCRHSRESGYPVPWAPAVAGTTEWAGSTQAESAGALHQGGIRHDRSQGGVARRVDRRPASAPQGGEGVHAAARRAQPAPARSAVGAGRQGLSLRRRARQGHAGGDVRR